MSQTPGTTRTPAGKTALVTGAATGIGHAIALALAAAGVPRWMADALIELYQDYRRSGQDGYAAQVHDGVRTVTGQAPRTLAQALADA